MGSEAVREMPIWTVAFNANANITSSIARLTENWWVISPYYQPMGVGLDRSLFVHVDDLDGAMGGRQFGSWVNIMSGCFSLPLHRTKYADVLGEQSFDPRDRDAAISALAGRNGKFISKGVNDGCKEFFEVGTPRYYAFRERCRKYVMTQDSVYIVLYPALENPSQHHHLLPKPQLGGPPRYMVETRKKLLIENDTSVRLGNATYTILDEHEKSLLELSEDPSTYLIHEWWDEETIRFRH